MTDYVTFLGTALNKRPEQLLGVVKRSLKSRILPEIPVNFDERYERRIPKNPAATIEPIRKNTKQLQRSTVSQREIHREEASSVIKGNFTFLHNPIHLPDGNEQLSREIIEEKPLQWKLKYWGFEHLKRSWLGYTEPETLPDEHRRTHRMWLDEWLEERPIAAKPGYLREEWMPHSVCLRIINWCRYEAVFGSQLTQGFQRDIRKFVYKNAAFLSDNVEYGVGGNHLIENAAALLIAGIYLNESRWRNQGQKLFERTASTQFFNDGGHIERSPMYHLLVTQRFLTAVSLLNSIGIEHDKIRECAADSVSFIENLQPPDNQIPLLNDSVFGEALRLQDSLRYAREVGVSLPSVRYQDRDSQSMPESGFYWLGEGKNKMLVSASDIAVPHLPGHAHAHPGQICLWAKGHRILTDTGVYEYASGQRRHTARSIRSHNTVQVANREPVRMASSFWLSGSISPEVEFTSETTQNRLTFSYTVDSILGQSYEHTRDVEYCSKAWTITDQVRPTDVSMLSRFHLHPDFQFNLHDGHSGQIYNSKSEPVMSVDVLHGGEIETRKSAYYPEFGVEISREVLTVNPDNSNEITIEFSL